MTVARADVPKSVPMVINWTTIAVHANATRHARTATNWTMTVARANAPKRARMATDWTTIAASVSPGHANACASPPPNRTTTPTDGRISVHTRKTS